MPVKLKEDHFSGASRVYAKDGTGLTDVLRGLMRDNAITRIIALRSDPSTVYAIANGT